MQVQVEPLLWNNFQLSTETTMKIFRRNLFLQFMLLFVFFAGCSLANVNGLEVDSTQSVSGNITESPTDLHGTVTVSVEAGITPGPTMTELISIPPKATITVTTNPTNVSPTPNLVETDEKTSLPSVYIYDQSTGYMKLEQQEKEFSDLEIMDYAPTNRNEVKVNLDQGPGDALYFRFAHYANKIAYWSLGTPGQLWISDLSLANHELIFRDEENLYLFGSYPFSDNEISLEWSPDDQYLVIRVFSDESLNLIYHVNSGILESWPYICDRIASSPKSQNWAVWCTSSVKQPRFAVIEWGGDIWYTEAAPEIELVKINSPSGEPPFPDIWSWSPDGKKIAFFDPNDPEGYLHIVTELGEHLKILQGSAYWLSEVYPRFFSPENLIQWAQNDSRILIFANGNETHSCPVWKNVLSENETEHQVPCWQIVDISSDEVIWTVNHLKNAFIDSSGQSKIHIWKFYSASLSPTGDFLILASNSGSLDLIQAIEVDTSEIYWQLNSDLDYLRWAAP